jgi:hypothetical protein
LPFYTKSIKNLVGSHFCVEASLVLMVGNHNWFEGWEKCLVGGHFCLNELNKISIGGIINEMSEKKLAAYFLDLPFNIYTFVKPFLITNTHIFFIN